MEIKKNISLAHLTSIQIGGPAEFFCEPTSLDELKKAQQWGRDKQITVLSGGTNVLISDSGIKGLVICLNKFKAIETKIEKDRLSITSLSGTPKSLLLKEFLKYKLAPAMFLAGLPGDVGGGVVMNAGIGEQLAPREFVEIIDWIEVLRDENLIRLKKSDLKFEYRHCSGWQPGIIVKVGMSWPMQPNPNVIQKVKDLNRARIDKQPLEWPNGGSVFVNPQGHKSGQLIEECGLKGFSIGGAQVSEKHGNFIINKGEATAVDVKKLVEHIQKTVKEKKGISLTPEWVLLGFAD